MILGVLTAAVFLYRSRHSASFALTLALLPMAVAGAFALVRFRSVPGTAREIAAILTAMALGLFDDVFQNYQIQAGLERIRTTNMETLFELTYHASFPGGRIPKEFLDELRARNGNLTIVVGDVMEKEML